MSYAMSGTDIAVRLPRLNLLQSRRYSSPKSNTKDPLVGNVCARNAVSCLGFRAVCLYSPCLCTAVPGPRCEIPGTATAHARGLALRCAGVLRQTAYGARY
eukprot:1351190-Rhodomonas_salina.2